MGENSKIEWTHHTFNPWWGCVKVSPACTLVDEGHGSYFFHVGKHRAGRTLDGREWNEFPQAARTEVAL